MKKIKLLHRAMVVNRLFSYAVLERQTELCRSFLFRKIKSYEKKDLVRRAGQGENREKLWRLTLEGKRQFDPKTPKEPVINMLPGGQTGGVRRHETERRLWTAIRELKTFRIEDLLEMKISTETPTRQYLALLKRAGLLECENTKGSRWSSPKIYTLSKDAGHMAPLMGRTFYIFDPNTGEYFATPMEVFEIEIEEKNGPGDAATSRRT
ncbi:MAG: hypothetical protein MI862_26570 [Desulfobacterales bacterium]|nr:hypothetical protein [Desulfobacterales bacterium]